MDAAASARRVVAGQFFRELVSELPARRTNDAICVRQNRVVLTSVADVKLPVTITIQPDVIVIKPAATVTR